VAMELGPVRLAAQAVEVQVLNETLVRGSGTLRTVARQYVTSATTEPGKEDSQLNAAEILVWS